MYTYTPEDVRVHAREDESIPSDDEVMAQYYAAAMEAES